MAWAPGLGWVAHGEAAQTSSKSSRRQKTKKAPEELVVPSGADAGLLIDDVVDRKKTDATRLI
jgi:hypothetical protein